MTKRKRSDEYGIVHDAEKIAVIVTGTSTEARGDLLYEVSVLLRLMGQYYTSSLFDRIANIYGRSAT